MKFAIITHVPHIIRQKHYFAYAPYVREMNLWIKYATKVNIVAPISKLEKTAIDIPYEHENVNFSALNNIDLLGFKSVLRTVLRTPKISLQIFSAMREADHIHLRCPGNIGLLGCLIQILFPHKIKTAKYAGNWDPKAKQPWSYRLQKWILSNTFLTRNMQVLVYGVWNESKRNIKPFFTATYSESEKSLLQILNLKQKINFVFVGTLANGKRPLYAIQLIELLFSKGYDVSLSMFGEGVERTSLEKYITANNLSKIVSLKGNQNHEAIKKAYQNSHFVVLPSKSEGWPKAIAEGMFWGCVPVATSVSCLPYMLDFGNRGILLDMNLENDCLQLETILQNTSDYENKRQSASDWSRDFTLDYFEQEIKKFLQS